MIPASHGCRKTSSIHSLIPYNVIIKSEVPEPLEGQWATAQNLLAISLGNSDEEGSIGADSPAARRPCWRLPMTQMPPWIGRRAAMRRRRGGSPLRRRLRGQRLARSGELRCRPRKMQRRRRRNSGGRGGQAGRPSAGRSTAGRRRRALLDRRSLLPATTSSVRESLGSDV